jgi:hypothetical protein
MFLRSHRRDIRLDTAAMREAVSLAALVLIGGGGGRSGWVWDYRCDCGLDYRTRQTSERTTFWPRAGNGGFGRELDAGQDCLKCAEPLSLEGCTVDVPSEMLAYGYQ